MEEKIPLQFYNTLTRKKEVFKPIKKGEVGLYSCGPTVYWYQHIGNMMAYLFVDTLKRVLMFNDYKVKHVINVTDVGHLTSDADEGEDKMEKAAKKEGKTATEIANFYFKIFRDDLKRLNFIEPNVWCKATEHIEEQIELIKKLEKQGYTYKTSDGIYFDTSRFKDYGKLSRFDVEKIEAGKRISMKEKKNVTDFALWKFSEQPGNRQQEWKSPWGVGYPGWHIECSAMSMKYLGEHFDIHTGGQEHIQIHHQNEIAQSEAATGKRFVNYWLHNSWLTFKGEKISKSSGGLYTLTELEKKGFSAMTYRYFCLTAQYRTQLSFSIENMENAKNAYERLKNIIREIKDDGKINEKYLSEFTEAVNDDLDTPKALNVLWNLVRDEKAEGKYKTIEKIDSVFGLDLLKREKVEVSEDVKKMIEEREDARKKKDWKKSDELRNEIKKKGYEIDDAKDGVRVKRI